MRFREKLYRFMQGRNGVDELARFENKVFFIRFNANNRRLCFNCILLIVKHLDKH